jgi:hypothetical protein
MRTLVVSETLGQIQTQCHELAYLATARRKWRDNSDDDDEDSEVTKDTSDQESTTQDDQS